MKPSKTTIARLHDLLGLVPSDFELVQRGYTATERWRCRAGTQRVFVKIGTSAVTADMLRRETQNYRVLNQSAASFLPSFIAADDGTETPILVIEDLYHAYWPPPWRPGQIDQVIAAIDAMHDVKAPSGMANTAEKLRQAGNGWKRLAADSTPWVNTRLGSVDWLDAALPKLISAADACSFGGNTLCHFDLRSDNMCITESGVKIVDWTEACASNPQLDTGTWLPSLAMEGGPAPHEIMPDQPEIAAWVAGYFAARAGLPMIPDAPKVRDIQYAQLVCALPWVIRELDLPALD